MQEPSDRRGWRPTVPVAPIAIAVVIALIAVSALLVLLFRRTTGPGEVLRDFSRLVSQADCPGSFALLDPATRAGLSEDEWCRGLPGVSGVLRPDFDIERVRLRGETAEIELGGPRGATWRLSRDGRSWLVVGPAEPDAFPIFR